MPVAQFPGDRNWGYDGVGLYAVQNSYGGPDGIARARRRRTRRGLAVILDVVYNHVGPEGNYLDAFGPYFTEKYRTPWGRALNYDDADSDEVRRFVVDNALYWITEYHIDGLRLDAVHGIFDFSATASPRGDRRRRSHAGGIARSFRGSDRRERSQRSASSCATRANVATASTRSGATTSITPCTRCSPGDRTATTPTTVRSTRWLPRCASRSCTMDDILAIAGGSTARRRVGIPRRRFVVAIQNHDQVGNRAAGERLASLLTLGQLRVAAALLLLSPYVPLIFMGEEFGETNPFQYFVSHGDERLVCAVREGRRAEFASFGWGDDVPDPQDDATFARSKLDWSKAVRAPHSRVLALYRDLLALRRDEPLLRPDCASVTVSHGKPGWITLLRTPLSGGTSYVNPLVAVFNCSDAESCVPMPASDHGWHLRLSTDSPGYGGSGSAAPFIASAQPDAPRRLLESATASVLHMAPWTASVYQAAAD